MPTLNTRFAGLGALFTEIFFGVGATGLAADLGTSFVVGPVCACVTGLDTDIVLGAGLVSEVFALATGFTALGAGLGAATGCTFGLATGLEGAGLATLCFAGACLVGIGFLSA